MEIDCEELAKQHLTVDHKNLKKFLEKVLNGRNIYIQYTALLFIYNNKALFNAETNNAFCDKCWDIVEQMLDEYSAVIAHFREHDPHIN